MKFSQTHTTCYPEFAHWKSTIEEENNFNYILRRTYSTSSGKVSIYNCNRSKASYRPKDLETRLRVPKVQGSCKMDSICPSIIKMKNTNDNIIVEWQKIHYGHDDDLKHIRLHKVNKQKIASKLFSGVAPQKILNDIRDSSEGKSKRVNLLTMQDIINIKRSYCNKMNKKHNLEGNLIKISEEDIDNELEEESDGNSQDIDQVILEENNEDTQCIVHEISQEEEEGEEEEEEEEEVEEENGDSSNVQIIRTLCHNIANANFEEIDPSAIDQIHKHLLVVNSLTLCKKNNSTNIGTNVDGRSLKRPLELQVPSNSIKISRSEDDNH
ncbi:hypothetical protein ABEB36_012957 [Hypothenemus hampei]|uniref:Uncharacterized protein n=1 Tax=Hypothenemus hampei TaxID=57062 RepID=A0ABD1E6N3_HYPHA